MRLLCESPIEKVQCWTFWTGDISLLFCVLGEGDGVLFEDVDEDIVEELFHDRVGAAEGRASVSRRREVVRELLDLLDDVAGARAGLPAATCNVGADIARACVRPCLDERTRSTHLGSVRGGES